MNKSLLLDELEASELIDSGQRVAIEIYERDKPVSLFVFLRTLLYVSISALVGGLGVVIYQNIDTIGHSVRIGLPHATPSTSTKYSERVTDWRRLFRWCSSFFWLTVSNSVNGRPEILM